MVCMFAVGLSSVRILVVDFTADLESLLTPLVGAWFDGLHSVRILVVGVSFHRLDFPLLLPFLLIRKISSIIVIPNFKKSALKPCISSDINIEEKTRKRYIVFLHDFPRTLITCFS